MRPPKIKIIIISKIKQEERPFKKIAVFLCKERDGQENMSVNMETSLCAKDSGFTQRINPIRTSDPRGNTKETTEYKLNVFFCIHEFVGDLYLS